MVFVSDSWVESYKKNQNKPKSRPAFIKIYCKTSLLPDERDLCFRMFDCAFYDKLWYLPIIRRYVCMMTYFVVFALSYDETICCFML